MRVGESAKVSLGDPDRRFKNSRCYDLGRGLGKVSAQSSLKPFDILSFVLMFAFLPAVALGGSILARRAVTNPNLSESARRALYSKYTLGSVFTGIALHAPFALFVMTNGVLNRVASLWLGTPRATSFSLLLFLPLLLLVPVFSGLSKREEKLFGPKPEDPKYTLPPPDPQDVKMAAKVSQLAMGLSFGTLIVLVLAILPFNQRPTTILIPVLLINLFGQPLFIALARQILKVKVRSSARAETIVSDLSERMQMHSPKVAVADPTGVGILPNAAAGLFTIRVTQPLLDLLDDADLKFVLAHELAHMKLKHLTKRTAFFFLSATVLFIVQILIFRQKSTGSMLPTLSVFLLMLPVVILVSPRLKKAQEQAADELALTVTGELSAAESALNKLMFASPMPYMHETAEQAEHPAISARIARLRDLAAAQGIA